MCGLAGIVGSPRIEGTPLQTIERMLKVQAHRGPDSSGVWCGRVHGLDIGLGFRRLKILDLSDAANQPMTSADGRYVLIYNGEIYNFLELRAELMAAGAEFHTRGDTEVLLQALICWGDAAFSRLNGMWALVLLDQVNGEVTLSRDRFGIKPLYTYFDQNRLLVSSEIKAILIIARRKFQIAPQVANAYLRQALLCASPATFFSGIEEFPAGHTATFAVTDIERGRRFHPQRYWTIPTEPPAGLSESVLVESVRETFIDTVKLRLRSDVPVGVLLSGGTDSSAIAAAVHRLEPLRDDIKLISAVAGNGSRDEEPFIDITAKHLNRHVEKVTLDFQPAEAFRLMSEVSWFNDEPIGNFSTVAHYLLMKRSRELGVTVLLSGQGADEILCGYKKYLGFYLQELVARGHWLAAAGIFASFLGKGTVLPQVTYQEAKRYLPKAFRLSEDDVRGPALRDTDGWIHLGLNGGGVVERQVIDVERLSVPALVHYEDRMSMAAAREIRLPFLDYRLVSLLAPMPVEFKLRSGWTKWIFRRAMQSLLPREIVWRKDKQHFIVPQNDWLRRELREDIEKLIDSEWVTESLGFLDRTKFRARYHAYIRQPATTGRLGFKDIFDPIGLELWARRFESHLSA